MEQETPINKEEEKFNAWFLDCYGIPFGMARQLATFDGDLGNHWSKVLEYLASGEEVIVQGKP